MTASPLPWWITKVGRMPLNSSTPVKVAIQARDVEHADKRLQKLYDPDIYAGYGPSRSLGEDLAKTNDPDDLVNASCHAITAEIVEEKK